MTSRPGPDRPTPDQDGDSNATSPGSTASGTTPIGNIAAVERIVERFGGIRPMANKLDTPVTTVQGWKKRGAIPLARHADLRAAAAKHRIKLNEEDLEAATPSEDRTVTEGIIPAVAPLDAVIAPPASAADSIPTDSAPDVSPLAATPGGDARIEPAPLDAAADAPRIDPAAGPVADADAPKLDPDAPKPDALATTPTTTTEGAATEAAATDSPFVSAPADSVIGATAYTKPEGVGAPRIETSRVPPAAAYIDEPRSGSGFATALSVVALLVGATALAQPWWGPRLTGAPAGNVPAAGAPADPALRAQVQQLTERLGKLEQRPAAAPGAAGAPADTAGLEATLRQLGERIDGLEKRPAAAAAASETAAPQADPRVDQLAERFGGIEQSLATATGESQAAAQSATQAAAQATQAAQDLRRDLDAVKQQVVAVNQAIETRRDAAATAQALVLAAGQLRSSLASGQPFQQDLQGVRALGLADAGVTQPLDSVAPFAAKGIPTQAQLTDRFRPLATEIVRAANRGPGTTWIDQVTGKLATLVTIRQQGGGVVGTSADAIVARAEAAVNESNLAAAVAELSTLEGPAAETAAPWLADAKARLAADQAGRQLNERAIALLTTAAGKGAAQ